MGRKHTHYTINGLTAQQLIIIRRALEEASIRNFETMVALGFDLDTQAWSELPPMGEDPDEGEESGFEVTRATAQLEPDADTDNA